MLNKKANFELQKEVIQLLQESVLFEDENDAALKQEYIDLVPTLSDARLKKVKEILEEYEAKMEVLDHEQLPKLREIHQKLMAAYQKEQMQKLHEKEASTKTEEDLALAELEKQFNLV